MVALKSSLPLVRIGRGIAISFDADWLGTALEQAARVTGCHPWNIADDLVAGVMLYLRYGYDKTVIDLPVLEKAVRRALRDTGYGDLAPHVCCSVP